MIVLTYKHLSAIVTRMKKSNNKSAPLPKKKMAYYGVGDFGLNFYWQGSNFLLLFFYTDILGLPNTLAGIAYAVGGLIDAFSDPTMGLIADRTRTKMGRYRPYLLYGAIPLGTAFALLFAFPLMVPIAFIFPAALISHIIFRLSFTAVSIPYSTLGTRLTFDARERSSIAGIRMFFGAMGGVAVLSLATYLRNQHSDDVAIFATGAIAGLVGSGFIFLSFLRTEELRVWNENVLPTQQYSLKKAAALITTNTPFMILITAMFLLTTANMIIVKTVIYRFEYILNAPKVSGIAMIIMTATPLITIPVWTWAYIKFDKRPAFLLGCGIVIIGLIALSIFGAQSVMLSIGAYFIISAGFSSFAVGFWSILPDTIDYGHYKTKYRVESGLIGFASATQKIAIALSGIAVGVSLDLFGYVSGAMQTQNTIEALHRFTAFIPILLMILTALAFSKYPLSSDKHQQIIKIIGKLNQDNE